MMIGGLSESGRYIDYQKRVAEKSRRKHEASCAKGRRKRKKKKKCECDER